MTTDHDIHPEEKTGAAFDLATFLEMRKRTRQALRDIAAEFKPGMREEEALEIATNMLRERGMRRGWHKILVRFGRNTLKNFSEPSEPGVVLQEKDIYFLDIGPVWEGHEGDAGETFVVGGDPVMQRCADGSKALFTLVSERWRKDGLTGRALYDYAATAAADMGLVLNLKMDGHRLSDFPHNVHHAGTLAAADFAPSANLWVLELQLRHPEREFGAFYEDLLIDDAG